MNTKPFEYKHIVSFKDTNLVGNVYFANHFLWQGSCREYFLKEKAPGILGKIENGNLALITLNCSCSYMGELKAFDEVKTCMYLEDIKQNRIKMSFDYLKVQDGSEKLIAKGSHEIGCFERNNGGLNPIEIPTELRKALLEYER